MFKHLAPSLSHAPCLAIFLAFGAAHAAAPAAAAARAPEALPFAKGDTATVKGKFKGPENVSRDFAVPMKAGQTLEVSLQDKPGTAYTSIYRPGAPRFAGEGRKKWTVHPTIEGSYVVHVFLTKSAAGKGESSTYELTVTRK